MHLRISYFSGLSIINQRDDALSRRRRFDLGRHWNGRLRPRLEAGQTCRHCSALHCGFELQSRIQPGGEVAAKCIAGAERGFEN
ncbi:hypothetical protein WH91_02640 [Devosia psychrophila]|uniref:Uncharacterized protein n=1 Tax=Devosia psychrophila TaxID=728005 RepID=A0ABR5E2W0_9HYPH|nr:hypothetical protein WH91_02640 [Devosia psychrophila]